MLCNIDSKMLINVYSMATILSVWPLEAIASEYYYCNGRTSGLISADIEISVKIDGVKFTVKSDPLLADHHTENPFAYLTMVECSREDEISQLHFNKARCDAAVQVGGGRFNWVTKHLYVGIPARDTVADFVCTKSDYK